ncbi:MAG TPA: response regulator transcription factor [Saprospiraceae bacterium]|nr:response regulator transcription factor [Saprospiraceae bacterium]
MKPHLLYAEDDPTLSFVTRDNLEMQGYMISHCADGKEAIDTFDKGSFDLCILDVMMPVMDGFQVAAHIRKTNTDIPIIFLTAKSLKEDKIYGLRLGADDYILKPFSIEELHLKIEIFLKRSRILSKPPYDDIYILGQFVFDFPNLSLNFEKKSRTLTQKEADVLKFFLLNKNQVIKRSVILENVWGEDDYFLGRSLDVFISRLRKYLNDDPDLSLENIHGVGFKLKMPL